MTADRPKSDAERIAELEAEVAKLAEICANLYNAIHYSHYTQQGLLKLGLLRVTGSLGQQEVTDQVNDSSSHLDDAMTDAKRKIWGDDYVEK